MAAARAVELPAGTLKHPAEFSAGEPRQLGAHAVRAPGPATEEEVESQLDLLPGDGEG